MAIIASIQTTGTCAEREREKREERREKREERRERGGWEKRCAQWRARR
jgi:hypothetical protein